MKKCQKTTKKDPLTTRAEQGDQGETCFSCFSLLKNAHKNQEEKKIFFKKKKLCFEFFFVIFNEKSVVDNQVTKLHI